MKLNFQTHSSTRGLKNEAEMRNGLLRHVFHSGRWKQVCFLVKNAENTQGGNSVAEHLHITLGELASIAVKLLSLVSGIQGQEFQPI